VWHGIGALRGQFRACRRRASRDRLGARRHLLCGRARAPPPARRRKGKCGPAAAGAWGPRLTAWLGRICAGPGTRLGAPRSCSSPPGAGKAAALVRDASAAGAERGAACPRRGCACMAARNSTVADPRVRGGGRLPRRRRTDGRRTVCAWVWRRLAMGFTRSMLPLAAVMLGCAAPAQAFSPVGALAPGELVAALSARAVLFALRRACTHTAERPPGGGSASRRQNGRGRRGNLRRSDGYVAWMLSTQD